MQKTRRWAQREVADRTCLRAAKMTAQRRRLASQLQQCAESSVTLWQPYQRNMWRCLLLKSAKFYSRWRRAWLGQAMHLGKICDQRGPSSSPIMSCKVHSERACHQNGFEWKPLPKRRRVRDSVILLLNRASRRRIRIYRSQILSHSLRQGLQPWENVIRWNWKMKQTYLVAGRRRHRVRLACSRRALAKWRQSQMVMKAQSQ